MSELCYNLWSVDVYTSLRAVKVQHGAGERRSRTDRKWLNAFSDRKFSVDARNGRENAMETESALTVCSYSATL